MSVVLEHVTKDVRLRGVPKRLFSDLNLEIGGDAHIAVLALPKSGKTTLLRYVCGTAQPDAGRIVRNFNVSWPIPQCDFALPTCSLAWNIRWLARLYGVKDVEFPRRVASLGGFTEYLNEPMANCPRSVRSQLGFGLGIAMDFDLYLFDNQILPQDKAFKEKALENLQERIAGKAALLATSSAQAVSEWCDKVYVLENGQLTSFESVEEGVEYYKAMLKASKQTEAAGRPKGDEDELEAGSDENERGVQMVQAAIGDII
jgi:capsular polysaccharide transport system ATP-binding protein